MKPFGKSVFVACAALVAASAIFVYAFDDRARAGEQVQPKSSQAPAKTQASPAPLPLPPAETGTAESGATLYDIGALPDPVKSKLERIFIAAQSGDLEKMRPVLESNGVKPLVRNEWTHDPIAYWKEVSADGSGRDILAAVMNVFSLGFVKTGSGEETIYVWPYFAKRDLTKLTPVEQVELYRIVPPKEAAAMLKSGKYTGYSAGISATGIWHYFLR
ncbi:hypothetical protein V6C03_07505 [Methyloligella sp. 2.7D]|uniref:hypothetical protein n=1 Tax=unclassified Methyloligella TaxID=2625955 RepID=UPI00157D9573|nr:hypothetical protein [Methyloligella sp. GL2]QKP78273.1 hypothetical protein HT051_12940 [Methyloligella sp. GL2]